LYKTLIPVLSLAASLALPVLADNLPVSGASFDIDRFEVDGNTVLKPSRIDSILTGFAGKARDSKDIEAAIRALERAYHKRGYVLAKVVLLDQEPPQGVVHLTVIEPRIGKIRIVGNAFHDEANIRRSLPNFTEGAVLNTTDLSVDIRIANENPSKKATPQLQAREEGDSIDATIEIADEKSWSAGAVLDNSGVDSPGRTHATAQYENFNLWGLDHILSLQYTTSTEHPDDVKIYGAGYHVPLYAGRDSLDFYASYSDVNSGSVSAGLVDLTVSGAGTVFGTHFTHNLPQLGIYNSQLLAGFDRKAFRNVMNTQDEQLGGDVTVDPLSLSYAGQWVFSGGNANLYLTALRNVPGGSHGGGADFAAARSGATPNYGLVRYGVGLTRTVFREWFIRLVVNGQATHDALIPGEELGVGGAASVRGLQERELMGDTGVTATAEIYTPDLCVILHSALTHCNVLGFVDGGDLSLNDGLSGEVSHGTVSSTGIGLRLIYGRTLSVQMDYGQVFSTSNVALEGDKRLHALIAVTF
jgi:hemolysin activation/secretion protein